MSPPLPGRGSTISYSTVVLVWHGRLFRNPRLCMFRLVSRV